MRSRSARLRSSSMVSTIVRAKGHKGSSLPGNIMSGDRVGCEVGATRPMPSLCQEARIVFLALFAASLAAQSPMTWKDPSPHLTRFVTVDKNVQLEVLDWGGSGRAVVLLAGGGN